MKIKIKDTHINIIIFNMRNAPMATLLERLSTMFPGNLITICNDLKQVLNSAKWQKPGTQSPGSDGIIDYVVVVADDIHPKDFHTWMLLKASLPKAQIVYYVSNPSLRYLLDQSNFVGLSFNLPSEHVQQDSPNTRKIKLSVTYQKSTLLIPLGDIEYFESNLRKLMVVTGHAKYEIYQKLSEVESTDLPDFVRCHKSFLVNLNHVKVMKNSQIELYSGKLIPVAQRRSTHVEKVFHDFVEKKSNIVTVGHTSDFSGVS
jgi:hypothetical protein